MRLPALSIPILVLLLAPLGAVARLNVKEACGVGETLSSSSFTHNGKNIVITTKFCPGFATLGRRSSSLERRTQSKRQVSICSSACTVDCANIDEQPFIDDCDNLTEALEALYPDSFLAPAQSLTTFNQNEACEYAYANLDEVDYSVCYNDVGLAGAITADDCFQDWPATTATAGGYCFSPGEPDNDWAIEVYYS